MPPYLLRRVAESGPEQLRARPGDLVARVSGAAPSEPRPDRFACTVAAGSCEPTVSEQDLTPELTRVVQVVLDQQDL